MSEAQIQQIFPGPCPPEGCPPPTEIVCIRTEKVYDFCFQQDTTTQCATLPAATCGPPFTCTVTNVTCTAGTPVPTGVDGFSTVSVAVTVTYTVTGVDTVTGLPCTTGPQTFVFTKTVVLCAPTGTFVDCSETTVSCGACTLVVPQTGLPQICCAFNICLIIESLAQVKLLVPAYGFCTPAPCRTGGFPPCPPSPLFPPQCEL
ncbi:MAG: hypothetical protein QME79_07920 [Bacillota bacterium]|nr:hypothetical protein [Bacillota bacterium]